MERSLGRYTGFVITPGANLVKQLHHMGDCCVAQRYTYCDGLCRLQAMMIGEVTGLDNFLQEIQYIQLPCNCVIDKLAAGITKLFAGIKLKLT